MEETALHFCGRARDVRLVKHLLSCGADGNVEDAVYNDDHTYAVPILNLACCSGRGEDLYIPEGENPWYLKDDLSMVETLIKYADVNKKASLGQEEYDPLGFAADGFADDEDTPASQEDRDASLLHHKKIVQLLVENGAKPRARLSL